MTPADKLKGLEELKKLKDENRLLTYKPYAKQIRFHRSRERERSMFGANRSGKTLCAGMETAMHLTGIYPDWWDGKRFKKAVRFGVGSETGDLLKKGPQRMLYGSMEAIGTGTIPKALLVIPPKMSRGVPDGIDTLQVRHCTNGVPDGTLSAAVFMSYADGRAKWASDEWDGCWLDEEPDIDIYTEGLTRTNTTLGPVMLTFTPLKGVSDVVMRFMNHAPGTAMISMSLDEAEHFTPEARIVIENSYPEHEREARMRGVPILGSGKIFKYPESQIKVEPFEIPKHFAVIGGMDFGTDHPFAAVKLAHDRNTDIVYLTQVYRERGLMPYAHAATLRHWGKIKWAWPHDGLQIQRAGKEGKQLAQMYRDEGLDLISTHAQYPDERGNGLEESITDISSRIETGRFKVFDHCHDFFEEYRYYHRKDGIVVKERDDAISAARYATMCLRYAESEAELPRLERYRIDRRARRSWLAA